MSMQVGQFCLSDGNRKTLIQGFCLNIIYRQKSFPKTFQTFSHRVTEDTE